MARPHLLAADCDNARSQPRSPQPPRRLMPTAVALMLFAFAGLPSCASGGQQQGASEHAEQECPSDDPLGSPEQFTLAGTSIHGVDVGSVETCGDKDLGYIRLDPAEGTRILILGRNERGEVDDCTPHAKNPKTCPRVNVDIFLKEVKAELESRGVQTIGLGLGACGDPYGNYDAWNVSLTIRDWQDADEAVEVLAEKVDEWDVETHSGVSVKGIPCDSVLERTGHSSN